MTIVNVVASSFGVEVSFVLVEYMTIFASIYICSFMFSLIKNNVTELSSKKFKLIFHQRVFRIDFRILRSDNAIDILIFFLNSFLNHNNYATVIFNLLPNILQHNYQHQNKTIFASPIHYETIEKITENSKSKKQNSKNKIMSRREKDEKSQFQRFKDMLFAKHKNFLRGWRLDLDRDGDERLSFHEFCNAAQNINYKGDIPALWMEMDKTGSSEVTLRDIDIPTFELVERFRKW